MRRARSSTVLSRGTAWPVMTAVGLLSNVKAAGTAASRSAVSFTARSSAPWPRCTPSKKLMPVDSLFQDRARLVLDRATEKKIRNGMIAVLPHLNSGEYRDNSALFLH